MNTPSTNISPTMQHNLLPAEVAQYADELEQPQLARHYRALHSYVLRLEEAEEETQSYIESLKEDKQRLEDLLDGAQKPCPNCN